MMMLVVVERSSQWRFPTISPKHTPKTRERQRERKRQCRMSGVNLMFGGWWDGICLWDQSTDGSSRFLLLYKKWMCCSLFCTFIFFDSLMSTKRWWMDSMIDSLSHWYILEYIYKYSIGWNAVVLLIWWPRVNDPHDSETGSYQYDNSLMTDDAMFLLKFGIPYPSREMTSYTGGFREGQLSTTFIHSNLIDVFVRYIQTNT